MSKLEPIKATPYMSVIEQRTPRQKIHRRLGDAKNAFDTPKPNTNILDGKYNRVAHTHGWGNLYEHINGEWVLLWEVPQPTPIDTSVTRDGRVVYETRPWRKGETDEDARDRVRVAASPQPEPGPDAGYVEGPAGDALQQGESGDDQRASGSGDGRSERLRTVLLTGASAATAVAESAAARWAESGWEEDRDEMIRLRERATALTWAVERLDAEYGKR